MTESSMQMVSLKMVALSFHTPLTHRIKRAHQGTEFNLLVAMATTPLTRKAAEPALDIQLWPTLTEAI